MCLLTEKKELKNTFWAVSNYFKVGYRHVMKIYSDSWEGPPKQDNIDIRLVMSLTLIILTLDL